MSHKNVSQSKTTLRVAELFAGVGGFRLALEGIDGAGKFLVDWSNQWEPSTRTVQHASDCYVRHFGESGHINEDILRILDRAEGNQLDLPEIDVVVGGFPCQDFSVARPKATGGIQGDKGALWWAVYRFMRASQPRYALLENVDRLLKSPADQRGRDFAIILESLSHLGYWVEWRVINAADYGYPQKRRRVFILAYKASEIQPRMGTEWSTTDGPLSKAFPAKIPAGMLLDPSEIPFSLDFEGDPQHWLQHLIASGRTFDFGNAGTMVNGKVHALSIRPSVEDTAVLGDVLLGDSSALDLYPELALAPETIDRWHTVKGAKRIKKTASNGHRYTYAEGALSFPDRLDKPGRTITTSEGGWGPGRIKHVVRDKKSGVLRRLAPEELERLNGFPDGWTLGMPDGRRAFMMGNALVVGIVERIGRALLDFELENRVGNDG